MWTDYLKAFAVGGALCALGQILVDKTKLTPARILTSYVVAGVILGAVGLYQPLADWAGAGATVPLTGFGNTLAKGVKAAVAEKRDNCDRAQKQLVLLESGQRIATTDDKGERQIMDDTEREKEMERARRFVSESCK